MVAAICGAAAKGVVAPAIMTGIAMMADQQLELPQWMAIKLPGVGEVNMPKMPSMPSMPKVGMPALPNMGKGGKAVKPKDDAIYIDENPNVTMNAPAAAAPKVRVNSKVAVPDAPTMNELKKKAGQNVTSGLVIDVESANAYQRFPVRRMPGKNMSSFLDMARDL